MYTKYAINVNGNDNIEAAVDINLVWDSNP